MNLWIVLSDESYEYSEVHGVFVTMEAVREHFPGEWTADGEGRFTTLTDIPGKQWARFLRAELHQVTA